MEAGTALTDVDRRPWLDLLAGVITRAIADRRPAVLACSALGRVHRDALRVDVGVEIFLTHVPEEEIIRRLKGRTGHFFNPALVRSQFEALETPAADEPTRVIDGNRSPEEIVEDMRCRLDQDDTFSGAPRPVGSLHGTGVLEAERSRTGSRILSPVGRAEMTERAGTRAMALGIGWCTCTHPCYAIGYRLAAFICGEPVASVSPSSIILVVNLLLANDLSSSNLVASFVLKTGG